MHRLISKYYLKHSIRVKFILNTFFDEESLIFRGNYKQKKITQSET